MDLFADVKRERPEEGVPIPARRPASDLNDFNLELELCSQDGGLSLPNMATLPHLYHSFNQSSLYGRFGQDQYQDGASFSKCDTFRMDDDDIFQVDKADLIQGPTLAELNANDDTLLDDLNLLDNLFTPDDNSFYLQIGDSIASQRNDTPSLQIHPPQTSQLFGLSRVSDDCGDGSNASDGFAARRLGAFSPGSDSSGAHGSPKCGLQELLTSPPRRPQPSSQMPQQKHIAAARLSSSAPTHLSLEQIWQRREPRKHLLSTGSLAEAGSTSSLSTGGVLSPGAHELSQDEDSDDDSDRYEDYSSDDSDAEEGQDPKMRKKAMTKAERYFWQYNIQAKGPKGQRLVLKTKMEDPHVLNEVTDPVFSPSCSLRGIKHSGKARKGDGNDLTPNPRKLYVIGKELDNLGRIINDMTPVSELPFNVRPKTRKEKNKLASRACRLKKKAQHEANKLKLFGLQQEHKQLMGGISQIKQIIANRYISQNSPQTDYNQQVDKVIKSATKVKIAGHSSEFVNKVLDKVRSGVSDGGLSDF